MIQQTGSDAVELLEEFVYVSVSWWTRMNNLMTALSCQKQCLTNVVQFYTIKEFYKHVFNTRDAKMVQVINELLPSEYS